MHATISPHDIYDDLELYELLELSSQTLSRARSNHQLQYSRLGNRTLYFGQWILDWINATSCHVTDSAREE